MKLRSMVLIILVLVMLFTSISSQATAYFPIHVSFGTVNGYVKTSNGNMISGATVTMYDSTGDIQQGNPVTTDSHGFYNFTMLPGTYMVTASRSDVGSCMEVQVVVTANATTSKSLTIYSLPTHIKLTSSKPSIIADGSDTVKITVTLTDAFGQVPGDDNWGMVNLELGNADSRMIDPAQFTNGAISADYGPIITTTTVSSVTMSVSTSGSLSPQLSDQLILNIDKPAPSLSPTPTPTPSPTVQPPTATPTPLPSPSTSPAPSATPPEVSQSAITPSAEATPIVSQQPVNVSASAQTATSNGTDTSSGSGGSTILIMGGLLALVVIVAGVVAAYFLVLKKH